MIQIRIIATGQDTREVMRLKRSIKAVLERKYGENRKIMESKKFRTRSKNGYRVYLIVQ